MGPHLMQYIPGPYSVPGIIIASMAIDIVELAALIRSIAVHGRVLVILHTVEVADGPRGRGVGMLLRGGLRAIHELLLLAPVVPPLITSGGELLAPFLYKLYSCELY